MKPYESQTFYELLEVDSGASADQIREAFERAQTLYGADSIAMYAVEDPGEADAFRGKLEEALETLSDPDKRDAYDRMLGLPVRSRTPLKSEAQTQSTAHATTDDAERAPTQLAMTEMLARAETSHSTHPEYQISYIPKVVRPPAGAQSLSPPSSAVEPPTPRAADEAAPSSPVAESPAAHVEPAPRPARAASPSNEAAAASDKAAAPAVVEKPVERVAPAGITRATPARGLEDAPQMAEESAIATAEAAMAQVSAKVRDAAVSKPRALEIPNDAPFNGELLRRVRESKGLSLAQVADRTRISKSHLENIEADRYEPLPATVYLRGMLASLARELGLDQQRVAKSYVALVGDRNKAK